MEIHSYDRFDSVVGAEQGTRGGHKQPGRAMGAELYEGPLEAPVGLWAVERNDDSVLKISLCGYQTTKGTKRGPRTPTKRRGDGGLYQDGEMGMKGDRLIQVMFTGDDW